MTTRLPSRKQTSNEDIMSNEHQYPQLTPAQVELWLASPVTAVYLQCLEWSEEQIREAMGEGKFIDSSSSEKTFAILHSALGEIEGLSKAGEPEHLMNLYKMIGEDSDSSIEE